MLEMTMATLTRLPKAGLFWILPEGTQRIKDESNLVLAVEFGRPASSMSALYNEHALFYVLTFIQFSSPCLLYMMNYDKKQEANIGYFQPPRRCSGVRYEV